MLSRVNPHFIYTFLLCISICLITSCIKEISNENIVVEIRELYKTDFGSNISPNCIRFYNHFYSDASNYIKSKSLFSNHHIKIINDSLLRSVKAQSFLNQLFIRNFEYQLDTIDDPFRKNNSVANVLKFSGTAKFINHPKLSEDVSFVTTNQHINLLRNWQVLDTVYGENFLSKRKNTPNVKTADSSAVASRLYHAFQKRSKISTVYFGGLEIHSHIFSKNEKHTGSIIYTHHLYIIKVKS